MAVFEVLTEGYHWRELKCLCGCKFIANDETQENMFQEECYETVVLKARCPECGEEEEY